MKTKVSDLKFFFSISLFSLIPFLIFFLFTVPCSDDIFYRNFAQSRSLWDFLVEHYNTWTGRYFYNYMMAVNPFSVTSNTNLYPVTMFALFSIFYASLYFLVRVLISKLESQLSTKDIRRIPHGIAIIITALFLHKMPRTADSLYWFAGASSHLLPMSMVFISVALYFQNLWESSNQPLILKALSIFLIAFFSFLISGSNETLAVQWIFSLMFAIFYRYSLQKRWDKSLALPLVVAIVGFGILYLSPGNAIRANELKGGHDIFLLLIKPWGLVIETTVRYLSLSLFAAVFVFYPKFKQLNSKLPGAIKNPRSLMLLGLFGLGWFLLTFVPSVWTMGGLPPRRVLNNTYLFFMLYGSFLLILFADKLPFLDRWSLKFSASQLKLIFMVSLLFFFNNFHAWKDLYYLPTFLKSLEQRSVLIDAGKNSPLVLPPLDYFPKTFFYEDITTKTDDYRNIVFAEFYQLKSVLLSKDYED